MKPFPFFKACFLAFLIAAAACRMRQPPSAPAPLAAPVPASAPAPEPAATETAPPPPTATPAAKKPARSAASSNPSPAPAPPAAAPVSTPAPKLGDVLTSDEQKQLSASIDQSLSRAQASLNRLNGRQLTKDQKSEVDQIQSFMKQAQATRNSDPAGAKSLAERAEVLARDLTANVH
jgi:hypothetical protein